MNSCNLLQLRDAVYAGKHPRIKLPAHALEKVAPRPTQIAPPESRQPFAHTTYNGTLPHQPLPPRPDIPQHSHIPKKEYSASSYHSQRPFPAKPPSSGIDPVLLTKSDHLIRAELQLKRQQIERALRDQYDKRGRANDPLGEDRETIDVEGILNKVHALVKPVSGLPTAPSSLRSGSFDENSYYSSKANTWSPEEADPKTNGADTVESLTAQANGSIHKPRLTAANVNTGPVVSTSAHPAIIDLDEEPYEPADDIEIYEPESATANVSEEQEESDYSPPPADIAPLVANRDRGRNQGVNGDTNGSSRRHSPVGNPPPIQNSRKRRREDKRGDRRDEKRRQLQANKRVVRSPQPYIKEEPQSPPPFLHSSTLGPPSTLPHAPYSRLESNHLRPSQLIPQDVEVVSTRDGRMQIAHHREQDNSPRSLRQYEEPTSPTVVRIPQRRVERDEHDLRRVASLQYARRPQVFSPIEPRQLRAVSHAFAERPVEHVYREASARPSAAPRYVRERSRSPGHEYVSRAQSPMAMPPPPRKIVVDQDGNQYYADPIAPPIETDVRASVAPPRRMEAERFYERASTREPAIRAPARHELYEEENVQRMPPPPRRFVEASDIEMVEGRPYRQREVSYRPLETEYIPREAYERRPIVQYEEVGQPREHVPRAYSMRPEPIRREPAEYAPVRYESVQPGFVRVAAPRYREVSVVHEAYDDRRYPFAAPPQGMRYVEEGAARERPIEIAQEAYSAEPRRVSHRY
ncbi:hypothetical protein B0J11DRAFT_578460 [Dendryphion nanum]|uniref:Uncharacterized protein n=1 Tax=Dendryphion nanum TaxID=256645 RepID=A0A9P9E005_9PLEO|nr:hypothetical protein B0J11DRAFT_578460 [Dendryphion nanum]